VKICAGRYRIPDLTERGILVVVGSNTRIDLTGVTLESGESNPAAFVGIGVLSLRGDSISVRGGRIHGYRFGVRLEGGRGHRVTGIDLSGSRAQALHSTRDQFDPADWQCALPQAHRRCTGCRSHRPGKPEWDWPVRGPR
jgi:hypothetical protein